jgi:cysteinyl-tRNA synthetase
MTLFLHNTLTRKKEEFKPIDPAHVRMYVCGPTVYDFAHLGNGRSAVAFDILYRVLKRHYPRVTYARNLTDIDDKIMAKAKETGEPIDVITKRATKAYHEDMAALNTLRPDIEPCATAHIPQMIDMISALITKGHAYEAEGHVLFNVPSMPDYGRLSRHTHDELLAGARIDVAPYKKDAMDFVLWKPSASDQVGWDSPWGHGRPGWHIECSAMIESTLGTTFDIHGGGLDLIFPHHENEIAQSQCSHDGAPLANYWMHNGFLTVGSDKMSKSLCNFHTVHDLVKMSPGEALRLALLSGHYRQPLDFSIESLKVAKTTLDRWYSALRNTTAAHGEEGHVASALDAALLDDLNTPLAIAVIHELVNELNRAGTPAEQAPIRAQLIASGDAIGLLQQNPDTWFRWQAEGQSTLSDSDIELQIQNRLAARAAKNYKESDRIRDALAAQGVILEDSAGQTTWRRG